MEPSLPNASKRPIVYLCGEFSHPDFVDVLKRVRADAIVANDCAAAELLLIAESRPGAIRGPFIESMRRAAPLAGIVRILGSWCEGESRTGKPSPAAHRLYWHEFPAWWSVQSLRRAAGLCPDWARPANGGLRVFECGPIGNRPTLVRDRNDGPSGVVVLRTQYRDTATALMDVLRPRGFFALWHRPGETELGVRGATAAVWDGAQLDEHEAIDLAVFCRAMVGDGAPVLALLDFPRRDSYDRALECGAAAVLGKPWRNEELIAAIVTSIATWTTLRAA